MNVDISFINKTDILPNIPLVGLGKHKKNFKEQIDCYDCDNCYSGNTWIPSGGTPSDCMHNCDCQQNCDCDMLDEPFDCNCDCDCDDYDYNCYLCDGDDWYPGGYDALCGDCNCDCDCYDDNCDCGSGYECDW